jgi:hypothetical protein
MLMWPMPVQGSAYAKRMGVRRNVFMLGAVERVRKE